MSNDLPIDETEQEYKDLVFDIKYDKEQFKDPMTIGLLLYRLSRERAKTNELYKQILTKLDKIQGTLSQSGELPPETLSEIDQKIVEFVKGKEISDAEEIQVHFGYKGKNAASARLNALFNQGVLNKKRAGKKVKYWVEQ